ncbi:MAG: hypothetical protein WCO88_09415 [Actinomycetota bacterium]
MTLRRDIVAAIVAFGLVACASTASGSPTTASNSNGPATASTVGGVGVLPPTVAPASTISMLDDPSSSEAVTTTTSNLLGAAGDRVIVIGDSILASTAPRYGNETCTALVPLNWQVEIDAEVSRQISFANTVLAARNSAGWDAGVIFLGTNFNRNYNDFLKQLNRAITTLGAIPIVLFTVTERSPVDTKVNAIIRTMPSVYPNVHIVDWAGFTAADKDLLIKDGLHPSTKGRLKIAEDLATLLGVAVGAGPGHCLATSFVDDTGGPTGWMPKPTIPTTEPPVSITVERSTSSTSRPATTSGGTTSTTRSSTSSSSPSTTTARSTTAAPTTAASSTAAPTTAAPTTAPPTTHALTTSPTSPPTSPTTSPPSPTPPV